MTLFTLSFLNAFKFAKMRSATFMGFVGFVRWKATQI